MAYRKQNWDKQTWLKGQKNVENMLNHIEDGIAEGGSGSLPEGGNNGDVLTKVITSEREEGTIVDRSTAYPGIWLNHKTTFTELENIFESLENPDTYYFYEGMYYEEDDYYMPVCYIDYVQSDYNYFVIDFYYNFDYERRYEVNSDGIFELDLETEELIPLTESVFLETGNVIPDPDRYEEEWGDPVGRRNELFKNILSSTPFQTIPAKDTIEWRQGIPDTTLANNGDVLTKVITPEIPSKKELKDSYTYEELEAFCGDIEEGDFKGVERSYYYDLNVRYYLAGNDSKYFIITYDDGDNTYFYNCNSPEHEDGWYDYGMGYVETTTPELFIPDDLTEDDFYNISDLSELDVLFNTTEPIPSKESIEWKQVVGSYDLELDFGELTDTSKQIDCDVSKILELYEEGKTPKVLAKFNSYATNDECPFDQTIEFTSTSITKDSDGIKGYFMLAFGSFATWYGGVKSVVYQLYFDIHNNYAILSYSDLSY